MQSSPGVHERAKEVVKQMCYLQYFRQLKKIKKLNSLEEFMTKGQGCT